MCTSFLQEQAVAREFGVQLDGALSLRRTHAPGCSEPDFGLSQGIRSARVVAHVLESRRGESHTESVCTCLTICLARHSYLLLSHIQL